MKIRRSSASGILIVNFNLANEELKFCARTESRSEEQCFYYGDALHEIVVEIAVVVKDEIKVGVEA